MGRRPPCAAAKRIQAKLASLFTTRRVCQPWGAGNGFKCTPSAPDRWAPAACKNDSPFQLSPLRRGRQPAGNCRCCKLWMARERSSKTWCTVVSGRLSKMPARFKVHEQQSWGMAWVKWRRSMGTQSSARMGGSGSQHDKGPVMDGRWMESSSAKVLYLGMEGRCCEEGTAGAVITRQNAGRQGGNERCGAAPSGEYMRTERCEKGRGTQSNLGPGLMASKREKACVCMRGAWGSPAAEWMRSMARHERQRERGVAVDDIYAINALTWAPRPPSCTPPPV